MSSFRLICIAALTAAMAVFVADAAAAQSATAADRSGKSYLAGLRPPHEQRTIVHAKTRPVSAHHQATTKIAQPAVKRRSSVTANAKTHRRTRLADKINSHVAWPSGEHAAADERTTPETVLQFATEDTSPAAAPRPALPAPATSGAKISPPAKIAATEERDNVDTATVDQPPSAAGTLVQTERFEAPASSQMRVIMPAPSEASVTAPAREDPPPAHSSSSTAQMLATLAGAITAGIVGWLMIGFGSVRTSRSG